MKNGICLLFFCVLAACGSATTRVDPENSAGKGGGKSFSIVLSGKAKESRSGAKFFLSPVGDTIWSREDLACIKQIKHAMVLSGFVAAETIDAAELDISVDLPKTIKAKGFSLLAFMGGFRQSVSLEARDAQKNTVWDLKAYADQELDDRAMIFPLIAVGMVKKFGENISDEETVSVNEYDARLEKIKAD